MGIIVYGNKLAMIDWIVKMFCSWEVWAGGVVAFLWIFFCYGVWRSRIIICPMCKTKHSADHFCPKCDYRSDK